MALKLACTIQVCESDGRVVNSKQCVGRGVVVFVLLFVLNGSHFVF